MNTDLSKQTYLNNANIIQKRKYLASFKQYDTNMKLFRLIYLVCKEIIAPKRCCHCGAFFSFVCNNCYQQIDFSFDTKHLQQKVLQNSPFLDDIVTVGSFSGPLKSLVLSLKYQGQVEVAYTLAAITYHTTWIPKIDLVTFVPAHSKRIEKRGFNQSQLIAQHLAKLLNKPCKRMVVRSKKIAAQATVLDKTKRKTRQKNTMVGVARAAMQNHKTILVVDDVFTTGATLNEAARALKQTLQAKKVVGLAIAQA
jgi:ComF family protein